MVVYRDEPLTQQLINTVSSKSGRVNQMREEIGRTTNYVSALEKVKECDIHGPVLFYSDGLPSDKELIEKYINDEELKKQSIDIIPILLKSNDAKPNKWMKQLGMRGVSNTPIDVLAIQKKNIIGLFGDIIAKQLIPEDVRRVSYKLFGVTVEKERLIDKGYFYCNNINNRIEIVGSGADAFKYLEIRFNNSDHGIKFGVDSSRLKKHNIQMKQLLLDRGLIASFHHNKYKSGKKRVRLFIDQDPVIKEDQQYDQPRSPFMETSVFSESRTMSNVRSLCNTISPDKWGELQEMYACQSTGMSTHSRG